MAYASLRDCVDDLERTGQLRRVEVEVDAHLEAAYEDRVNGGGLVDFD